MKFLESCRAGRGLLTALLFACLVGCAGTKKDYVLAHEPFLRHDGGPILIADVCVQQDALGDADDYFMVREGKDGARRLLETAKRYLGEKGLAVKATLVPFACGVIGNNAPLAQLVSFDPNLPAQMAERPFAPSDELAADPTLKGALVVLATAGYERAIKRQFLAGAADSAQSAASLRVHSEDEIRAAASIVKTKMSASSLVYIGVNGYSQSTGKAAALGVGRFLFALGTVVATGGALAVIPGQPIDGRIMTVFAVDLQKGELVWANSVRGSGDPQKPAVVADPQATAALLHGLVHREVTATTN